MITAELDGELVEAILNDRIDSESVEALVAGFRMQPEEDP